MSIRIQRSFIIGDTWLYYKIYTGYKTSDVVLTEVVKPLAEKLIEDHIVDKWFFIRYGDPEHHIRVRFHFKDTENIRPLIQQLHSSLRFFVDQDLIWKVQTDTYQREVERYGTNTMEISEELFYHDSKMIVDFLDMIEGEEGEELRWLFSLRAVDSFLHSYQYKALDKLVLLEQLKTSYGSEFGMSRPLKKQIDQKYREERGKIEEFMNFRPSENPEYAPLLKILDVKAKSITGIVEKTLDHKRSGYLQVPMDNLMASYIHMLMNRIFKSKNRMHEMVCYDFLFRYYRSAVARSKVKAV